MEPYTPTIIKGEQRQDDEILAKTPLDAKALGGDNSVIIMELLQRFKVRDVMKRTVISISRDTSMREAQRIMRENRISGVPVSEDGRLFGIVSVNDIINALDNGWIEDTCERHMACNLVVLEAGMPISFALRYFTENAWRPGGKTADALLPAFCRDRYAKQAELFESIWRKTIPVGLMNEYWGNYASYLTAYLVRLPPNNYNTFPMTQMLDRFRSANKAFAELAEVEWSDGFAVRDSVDLARTLIDRMIEMKRQQMQADFERQLQERDDVRNAELV